LHCARCSPFNWSPLGPADCVHLLKVPNLRLEEGLSHTIVFRRSSCGSGSPAVLMVPDPMYELLVLRSTVYCNQEKALLDAAWPILFQEKILIWTTSDETER
jgi:hypothetical protein